MIVLGTAWPFNHFRLYRDFLSKILLLEETSIDAAPPVVVPDELFDQPIFRDSVEATVRMELHFALWAFHQE